VAQSSVRLRLFNPAGVEVASLTQLVPHWWECNPSLNLPSGRKRVTVTSTQPVAFAIMDVVASTEKKVFVIDNFRFYFTAKPATHATYLPLIKK
jgi:hypothetical protein